MCRSYIVFLLKRIISAYKTDLLKLSLLKHLFKHYLRNSETNFGQVFYKSWEIFNNFFTSFQQIFVTFLLCPEQAGWEWSSWTAHSLLVGPGGKPRRGHRRSLQDCWARRSPGKSQMHTRGGGVGGNSWTPSKDFKKLGHKNALKHIFVVSTGFAEKGSFGSWSHPLNLCCNFHIVLSESTIVMI